MEKVEIRQNITSLSILFVVLLIGLPTWWKTTEVYRSPLPYQEISSLSLRRVPSHVLLTLTLVGLSQDAAAMESLARAFEMTLQNTSATSGKLSVSVQFKIEVADIGGDVESELVNHYKSAGSISEFCDIAEELLPSSELGHYRLMVIPPGLVRPDSPASIHVGQHRLAVIQQADSDVLSAVPFLLQVVQRSYGNTHLLQKTLANVAGVLNKQVDKETKRQVKAAQGYQISVTLINPDPAHLHVSWNVEEATKCTLLPFLSHPGINRLGNFTVNSQVFYHTDVKFHPKEVLLPSDSSKGFYVTPSQLPPMISNVESKLGSLVSHFPNLNFLVYIPRGSECPLHVALSATELQAATTLDSPSSFLVPQWGGVVFYNGRSSELQQEKKDERREWKNGEDVSVRMETVMPIFTEQLKLLLGVPKNLPSESGITFNSGRLGITDWQVDQLLISKMVESASIATSSLVSLVQLLGKVRNMVISDDIQQEVVSSVNLIQLCYERAASGDISSAYTAAKDAMMSAETAFFDPSILELLYFPEDQKFAIYIPLFLPVGIPVVLSSVGALKWLIGSLKTQKKNNDQK